VALEQPPEEGTVLESFSQIQDAIGRAKASKGSAAIPPIQAVLSKLPTPPAAVTTGATGACFRPISRPPAPLLISLDDGDLDGGEIFRIRAEKTLIGRTDGDVRIDHDSQVSSRHAEIVRVEKPSGFSWILHDLNSSNGTFVRCSLAKLGRDAIFIIGARRFRFELPSPAASAGGTPEDGTKMFDSASIPVLVWPSLVEVTSSGQGEKHQLRSGVVTIGCKGSGCDIILDDPLVADNHATILCDSRGAWSLKAAPSTNGVWARINQVKLTESCHFRCGEQCFRFVLL